MARKVEVHLCSPGDDFPTLYTHTHTHTQTQKKWLQLLIPQRGYNHVKSSNTTYYINFFVYLYAIIYPVLPIYGQNPLLPLTVGHKSELITVTVKISYVN